MTTRRDRFNAELLKFNAALERYKTKNAELLVYSEILEQRIAERDAEIKWQKDQIRKLKRGTKIKELESKILELENELINKNIEIEELKRKLDNIK